MGVKSAVFRRKNTPYGLDFGEIHHFYGLFATKFMMHRLSFLPEIGEKAAKKPQNLSFLPQISQNMDKNVSFSAKLAPK